MEGLKDIHSVALTELKRHFLLKEVLLRHPFPERPRRLLGLVKIDGEVFSAEKLSRIVMMKSSMLIRTVYSIFIRPRLEFDLPVFSCEVVMGGRRTLFLLDVHRAGGEEKPADSLLFDKLIRIRDQYPQLMKCTTSLKGEIQHIFSKAVTLVKIGRDEDFYALNLFKEYLGVYLEIVGQSSHLTGDALLQVRKAYEEYLKTVVEHDPGVKMYKLLFGKKGGIERALDIFFALEGESG